MVCTVRAASLQACGVVFPLAMLTSICRSIVTICSGLYLCMGMTRFSSKWTLSHSTWYKNGRAGQHLLGRGNRDNTKHGREAPSTEYEWQWERHWSQSSGPPVPDHPSTQAQP